MSCLSKCVTLKRFAAVAGLICLTSASGADALTINVNPVTNGGLDIAGSGADPNAQQALDAFNRAADQWEALFSDDVTLEINADLRGGFANANVIGQASSTLLTGGFDLIRNAMVADAADESDDGVVAFLPTASEFTAFIPTSVSLENAIILTQANALALGLGRITGSDALIEFNSAFNFDFDNSDGVVGTDFETVALHEIGHALGFLSVVDDIDILLDQQVPDPAVSVRPLDLFRFGNSEDPFDAGSFTNSARNLVPGTPAFFDDLDNEFAFSTGRFLGDGRQASHWRDDLLTGNLIGVMDPTLGPNFVSPITAADIRAFDLIGWDFDQIISGVPEPRVLFLLLAGLGLIGMIHSRQRPMHTKV